MNQTILLSILGLNAQNLQGEMMCLLPTFVNVSTSCFPSPATNTPVVTLSPIQNEQRVQQYVFASTRCICAPASLKNLHASVAGCVVKFPELQHVLSQLDYFCAKIETCVVCNAAAGALVRAAAGWSGANVTSAACGVKGLVTGFVDRCTQLKGFDAQYGLYCKNANSAPMTGMLRR
ncbi:hypothetical protein BC830DRAFT_1159423 [Chytriomyces sp. MP71]|nr:hypothetical protein BC830DRAFT_1159423 [Chytriomyces sp. MP71]